MAAFSDVANEVNSGDQSRRLILQAQLKDTVNDNEPQRIFRRRRIAKNFSSILFIK
jgi:hypothetical protein